MLYSISFANMDCAQTNSVNKNFDIGSHLLEIKFPAILQVLQNILIGKTGAILETPHIRNESTVFMSILLGRTSLSSISPAASKLTAPTTITECQNHHTVVFSLSPVKTYVFASLNKNGSMESLHLLVNGRNIIQSTGYVMIWGTKGECIIRICKHTSLEYIEYDFLCTPCKTIIYPTTDVSYIKSVGPKHIELSFGSSRPGNPVYIRTKLVSKYHAQSEECRHIFLGFVNEVRRLYSGIIYVAVSNKFDHDMLIKHGKDSKIPMSGTVINIKIVEVTDSVPSLVSVTGSESGCLNESVVFTSSTLSCNGDPGGITIRNYPSHRVIHMDIHCIKILPLL